MDDGLAEIIRALANNARNDALEHAATLARVYGAPAEAVVAILSLKSKEKEAA